uniref:Transcription factor bHLH51 n=1 Tax=Anthurium amnicola TaxID=1678845 RepID=A0A1D1YZP5_9ARAE
MMGSYGWQGDGDGEGAASLPLPPQRYGGRFILPCPPGSVVGSPAFQVYGPSPSSSSSSSAVVVGGTAVAKAAAASRIHSLAERGRRERINGHLSTLRRMIPNADKMDKATLLRSVIHEVRVLKRKAVDVSKHLTVPAEVNQVSVECDEGNDELPADKCCPLIKASICCDDRPDLYADIVEAFHRLRLRAVRADIASLGGRVRHAFVLRRAGSGGEDACLSSLMESTRQLLGKVASVEDAASSSLLTKRRRRLFHSHHHPYVPC